MIGHDLLYAVSPSSTTEFKKLGPHRIGQLCQVLSETVTSHPANQADLRKQDVLGRKHGVDVRINFVQDVFDSIKLGCGAAVMRILDEKRSTADWDAIISNIVELLAQMDLTFPQPFDISNFHVQAPQKYEVERLYLDRLGFVANINQGNQIETFHALYTSIQSITSASENKTHITILFSPPPSVGQVAVASQPNIAVPVEFDIDSLSARRFSMALKSRAVNIAQGGRKLSKAEQSLKLDYEPEKSRVTTQDKQRGLARLWDLNNSHLQPGQTDPTSPLMSVKETPQLPQVSPSPTRKPVTSKPRSPDYESVFGTTDEELTDLSDTESKVTARGHSRKKKQSRPNAKLRPKSIDSVEEISILRKPRKNNVVLSDEDTDSVKSQPQQTSMTDHNNPSSDETQSAFSRPDDIPALDSLSPGRNQASPSSPPKPKPSRKRKSGEEDDASCDPVEAIPSPKRPRGSLKKVDEVSDLKLTRKPPPAKRYGKRGRLSSPSRGSSPNIDAGFYELSKSTTDALVKVDVEKPSRVSGMKGKGVKSADKVTTSRSKLQPVDEAAPKPIPTKKVPKKGSAAAKVKIEVKSSPNLKPKPQRRSSRVAKAQVEGANATQDAGVVSAMELEKPLSKDGKQKVSRPRKKAQAVQKKACIPDANATSIPRSLMNADVEDAVQLPCEEIGVNSTSPAPVTNAGSDAEITMEPGNGPQSCKEPQQIPFRGVAQTEVCNTADIAPGIKEATQHVHRDIRPRPKSRLLDTDKTKILPFPMTAPPVHEVARIDTASTSMPDANAKREVDEDKMLVDVAERKVIPQHSIKNLPKRSFIDLTLNSPLPPTAINVDTVANSKATLNNKSHQLLESSRNDLDLSIFTAPGASPSSPTLYLPSQKTDRPRVSFAPSTSFVNKLYDLSIEFEPHASEIASPSKKSAAKTLHKNPRQTYNKKYPDDYLHQPKQREMVSTHNSRAHFSEDEYTTKKRNTDPMPKIMSVS
ncbi:hypothetical protein H0H92_009230 [Tricholoma furcatifolium]|nr:hypothetical protein H0H92_009230 [Tricholoma furcatifolium]